MVVNLVNRLPIADPAKRICLGTPVALLGNGGAR